MWVNFSRILHRVSWLGTADISIALCHQLNLFLVNVRAKILGLAQTNALVVV